MTKNELIKELARQMGVPVVDVTLPSDLWSHGDALGLPTNWKARHDEVMCDLVDTAVSLNDKCTEIDKLREELAECRVNEWERKLEEKEELVDAIAAHRDALMQERDVLRQLVIDVLKRDVAFWSFHEDNPTNEQKVSIYYTITSMLERYASEHDLWDTIRGE